MDLRCPNKKQAEVVGEAWGIVETRCDSRFCGAGAGVAILHRFDLATGELVSTTAYKIPQRKGVVR